MKALISIKTQIAKILTSSFFNRLILHYQKEIVEYDEFLINIKLLEPVIVSRLFWGIYESSEIRFIKKYLTNDYNVVELGASIGILTLHISKFASPRNVYSIEADPDLCNKITSLLDLNTIQNVLVYNLAISYKDGNDTYFSKGNDTTTGKVTDDNTSNTIKVPASSLHSILKKNNISKYTLVCDIEGSEADIIINDPKALMNCQKIIMETHKVVKSNKVLDTEDYISLLTSQGFKLVDKYGPVIVMDK